MDVLEIGEKFEGVEINYRENAFGIVEKDGRFLMVYTSKDRNHSLPGGGIEPGETPEEAINREFIEEAGFKIKSAEEIVQVHCYWHMRDGRQVERYSHIFKIEIDENSKMKPLEDWHTRVYVDVNDAEKLTPFPYQKAGIEYYLRKFKS